MLHVMQKRFDGRSSSLGWRGWGGVGGTSKKLSSRKQSLLWRKQWHKHDVGGGHSISEGGRKADLSMSPALLSMLTMF